MSEQPRIVPIAATVQAAASGRGLVGSAGALITSRLIVAGLGWAGTILIVRALTPTEWGQFSLVFSVLAMLSFMTSLGASRIVLAELSRLDDEEGGAYAGSYVVLRLLLGATAYAAAVLFVVVAGYPREVVNATAVAGVILVVAAAGSGLDVVFQSKLRLGAVATAHVVGQLGQLSLTLLVALTRPDLLLFVLPAIAFDVIAAWWKARRVRRLLPLRLHVDVAAWRLLLRQAAPLAAGTAFATIALSVDLVVLSKVDAFDAVGGLAVADKFVLIVAFVPLAVEPPLIALMVRYWPAQLATFHATVRRGMLIMSLAGGLVLVGFMPVAGELMGLLYGQEYRAVATTAQLSVLAGCLQFYSHVILAALVAMGRNRDFLLLNLAVLITTLAASLVLVPRLSVLGAGLSRLTSAVLMLVIVAVVVRRRMSEPVLEVRRHVLVATWCGVGLAVGTGLVQLIWWPLAAALGVAVYLALVELSRAAGSSGLRSLGHDLEVDEPAPPGPGPAGSAAQG